MSSTCDGHITERTSIQTVFSHLFAVKANSKARSFAFIQTTGEFFFTVPLCGATSVTIACWLWRSLSSGRLTTDWVWAATVPSGPLGGQSVYPPVPHSASGPTPVLCPARPRSYSDISLSLFLFLSLPVRTFSPSPSTQRPATILCLVFLALYSRSAPVLRSPPPLPAHHRMPAQLISLRASHI